MQQTEHASHPAFASGGKLFWLALASLALGLMMAGCGSGSEGIPSLSTGSSSFGSNHVSFGKWGEEMAVLIWTDLPLMGSEALTKDDQAIFRGAHGQPRDHTTRIEWYCQTPDGVNGKVLIGGSSYQLTNGPVFLALRGPRGLTVRQLRRHLQGIEVESLPATLEQWRMADPTINSVLPE